MNYYDDIDNLVHEDMDVIIGSTNTGQVSFAELAYKDTEKNNVKEIVYAVILTTRKSFSKDSMYIFKPKDGGKEQFVLRDISKEYTYTVKNRGESYVHIFLRNAVKTKVTVNESLKRNVSAMDPLVFIDSVSPTFKQKANVYQIGKTISKYAYVSNMLQPDILAKHIDSESREEATAIIEDIQAGGINKTEFNSKKYALAEYYINIYKNWVEEYFNIVLHYGLLKKLDTRVSNFPVTPYFVLHEDGVVEPLLKDGIKSGKLAFTRNTKKPNVTIRDNKQYTEKYAVAHSIQINNIAKPLHYNGDIRPEIESLVEEHIERKLFKGQINAVDAMLKALDVKKNVTIVGEMGVGKTSIMAATMLVHNKLHYKKYKKALKGLVFSPDHIVVSGWEGDLKKLSSKLKIHHLTSVNDLIEADKKGYLDDDTDRIFILGQEKAKRKFASAPYPIYNKNNREFSCSTCGGVITRKVRLKNEDGSYDTIVQPVSHLYFATKQPTKANKFCKKCGASHWAIENSDVDSSMFYSKAYKGFLPKCEETLDIEIRIASSKVSNASKGTVRAARAKLALAKEALAELRGETKVVRRVSDKAAVAHYIFKKMKYRFTHLIADEAHEFQGNSLRYEALKWLVKSIRYTITGTGTAMNGYANSRFRTDFLLNPATMLENGYRHDDADKFQEDFGVIEKRYYDKTMEDGTIKRIPLRARKKPSINPAVFPKFMQDCCVFVTMDDMEADMPKLTYIPMPVKVAPDLRKAYETFIEDVRRVTAGRRKDFQSVFQTSNLFLDAPNKQHHIKDPKTGNILVSSPVLPASQDRKLEALLEVANDRVNSKNKNMLVYVHFKEGGIKEYLKNNLEKNGFKVAVLNSVSEKSETFDGKLMKVEKENREFWIRNQVKEGAQIVICNPTLVQTGCNLIELPVIVNYQLSYQSYTIRQADRRAWRLNQTEDCEVINIFYADTIQHQTASLMATKIVSARSIEGNMDSDGLEALCDSRTAEEEMAAEFYKGVKTAIEAAS